MLELPVAAFRRHQRPPVSLEESNHPHAPSPDGATTAADAHRSGDLGEEGIDGGEQDALLVR